MTPQQKGRATTVGIFVALGANLVAIILGACTVRWQVQASEKAAIEQARDDAAWRAHADEHARQCAEGIDGLSIRLGKIEDRINAFESWPRLTK